MDRYSLQEFSNAQFGTVHTLTIGGVPYFVGHDVAQSLGYRNPRDALMKHVDEEDRDTVALCDGTPGNPNQVVINESGLYSLIHSLMTSSGVLRPGVDVCAALPPKEKAGSTEK